MPGPLIDAEDRQPDEKLEIRIRPEVARELRAYGEYVSGSSPSHVVAAALKRLFREDREFKEFLKAHPEAGSIRVQKIRKAAAATGKGAA
jgi:hypothetical protein